jgi:hypothetical protein
VKIHLLSLAHIQTTPEYYLVSFAQTINHFANICTDLGYQVILYGSDENCARVHEHVSVLSKSAQSIWLGNIEPYRAPWEAPRGLWDTFNARVIAAMRSRAEPGDLICSIGGHSQKTVFDAFPELLSVEFSCGYQGACAAAIAFESYAWRAHQYGHWGIKYARWLDTVIPCYLEPQDFPFNPTPGDYLLYCGRIVKSKGVHIAARAAQVAGVPLVAIGPVDPSWQWDSNALVDYRGVVSCQERAALLGGARAVLMPTEYSEPFGLVLAEAMACGTPVIGTDWGAFPENIPAFAGAICSSLGEFVAAIENARRLDRAKIAAYARSRFSVDAAKVNYARYFARIESLAGNYGPDALFSLPTI